MNKNFVLKTSLIVAGLLALPMANAAGIAKADYQAGKTRIDAAYKADKTTCGALAGNVKDVCSEEAQAKQKVARAELGRSLVDNLADTLNQSQSKGPTRTA